MEKYNGWLFRWARHLWCGMIHGHVWAKITPELPMGEHGYKCVKCGKVDFF